MPSILVGIERSGDYNPSNRSGSADKSARTSSGKRSPYCWKLLRTDSALRPFLIPFSTRTSMSVPMQWLPCAVDATSSDPVPTKQSHITAPGRESTWFDMRKASSAQVDVGPMYFRRFKSKSRLIVRWPFATSRPKKTRLTSGSQAEWEIDTLSDVAAVEAEQQQQIGMLHLDGPGEVDSVEKGLDVLLLVGRRDALPK